MLCKGIFVLFSALFVSATNQQGGDLQRQIADSRAAKLHNELYRFNDAHPPLSPPI